jgi:hypothetical protein
MCFMLRRNMSIMSCSLPLPLTARPSQFATVGRASWALLKSGANKRAACRLPEP